MIFGGGSKFGRLRLPNLLPPQEMGDACGVSFLLPPQDLGDACGVSFLLPPQDLGWRRFFFASSSGFGVGWRCLKGAFCDY
jgi:hypothetical protein